jgi:hypothetical protein
MVTTSGSPSIEVPGWQGELLTDLLPVLQERFPNGARFGVTGSVATGTTDRLSDLDVVVVADDLPDGAGDVALLSAGGSVWSIDRQESAGSRTLRAVYTDGRRIDLSLRTTGSEWPEHVLWLATAAPAVGRPPTNSSERVSVSAAVMAVRHVSGLAAAKLGRRDLLIGAHLCLEVARQALVVSMRVRDEEEGRSHHRHGSPRDRDALRVSSALSGLIAEAGPEDWIDCLLRLTEAFDVAAHELWPDHKPDWQGLDAIVVAARTTLADPSE